MKYTRAITFAILALLTISMAGCFSSNPKDIEAFLMPAKVNVTARSYIMHPPDTIAAISTPPGIGAAAG